MAAVPLRARVEHDFANLPDSLPGDVVDALARHHAEAAPADVAAHAPVS